ncbi:MAG: SEC-C metal-binding domain-containing protein, partial [Desulfobacterales bacterium]|nr:SEC-C metal-binding domain-containing protein [Desulfobacterales bacterium]
HYLGNIRETPPVDLIGDPRQAAFGRAKWDTLPRYCRECEVLSLCNGGCPKDRILLTSDGEAGLNYLCAGYKRFFNHCRPFLDQLSGMRARESQETQRTSLPAKSIRTDRKVGRNDPCPCGSGRKYKKCCMGKVVG